MNLADNQYWTGVHNSAPELSFDNAPIRFKDIFEKYVRPDSTCFEVGCYPGRYLLYLAKRFNCPVSGVDFTNEFCRMIALLKSRGVPVVNLHNQDFTRFGSACQYDFVYSLGFIEHFDEYEDIIIRHIQLVQNHGILFLETPNFTGVQRLLHSLLDREALRRHNLNAMNLKSWRRILEQNGMRILQQGYYNTFDFWISDDHQGQLALRTAKWLRRLGKKVSRRVNLPNRFTSPYIISVSQRIS